MSNHLKKLAGKRKGIFKFEGISLLFLILITFLIYSNTFYASFHFDDMYHILENKHIRLTEIKLSNLKDVVNGSFPSRPFPMLTFAINYYFGQYNVTGYHIVNIVIHLINGILLYFLIKTTLDILNTDYNSALFIAFFTALIWLVHPLQTQSVTYIIQRMNSMAVMFYVLSLLSYAKGRIFQKNKNSKKSRFFFCVCIFSGVVAMGCKELAATLPFFIILYELYFFQYLNLSWFKKHIRWILFILISIFIYAAIILVKTPEKYLSLNYSNWPFTLNQRLLTELRVVIYYINLLFYPNPNRITLDYDFPLSFSLFNPITTLFSLICIIGLIGLSFSIAKRERLLSFCILWFFCNLAIESSIFPLDIIFEHRTYLPSMFISFMFVILLNSSIKSKWLSTLFFCTIVLIFCIWTYERNYVWKDEFTLWQDCVKKSPNKGLPHLNLGNELENQGKIDEAIYHYLKALAIKPYYSKVHNNLGYALTKQGKIDEAIWHYNEAIRTDPNYAKAYNGLGVIRTKQGKTMDAVLLFSEALLIDPDNTAAKDNLEKLLLKQGKKIENYNNIAQELPQLFPKNPMVNFQLGNFFKSDEKFDKAIDQYKKALLINPDFIPAINNLAILYAMKEEYDNSLSLFNKIAELKGDNADTDYNIARIYAVKNMKEEAVYWLKTSVDKGFNKWNVIKTDNYLKNIRDTLYYKEIYDKK